MSSTAHAPGPRQILHNGSMSPAGRQSGTLLPPIVAPPDGLDGRDGPHSAPALGRPPLSRTSSISSEQSLPRVHHILNPPPGAPHERMSNPPTPDGSTLSGSLPPHSLHRSSSNERLTPTGTQFGHTGPPRLAPPTGTIDAKKSPFLPTTSQGPPVAAGPTGPSVNPVLGPRPGYPPAHVATFPGAGPRPGSEFGHIGSRTASPASTHSSYGQPSTAQDSPRSVHSTITGGPHAQYPHQYHAQHQTAGYPGPQAGVQQNPHPQGPYAAAQQQSPHHQPVISSAGPYRMLTIDTEQGPIQVPVDVQAASKMADEKRKRNAGASARFRQRRKEKEREAAQTITRLENQMRELEGDREFYRMERDYFRDLVYKHEGAKANMVPRMPSPGALSDRKRQASLTSSREDGGLSPSSAGGGDYRETGDRGSDDGRILRRRISEYERDPASIEQAAHHTQPYTPTAHSYPEHQHQHQHQQQQSQHPQPQHQPPPHHHRLSGPPPPISVQQANAHYSLPTPDSRAGTPGSAPLQHGSIPPAMRAGPYESTGWSGPPPVTLETRWAAPS